MPPGCEGTTAWASWQPDQHLLIVIFLGNSDGDWAVSTLKSPKGTVLLLLPLCPGVVKLNIK